MIYSSFARKIEIDEEGVRYTSLKEVYKIEWEKIKEIGIADFAPFSKGANAPFIFFSQNIGNSLLIFDVRSSENCIFLRYRKSVIKTIREYWDKEIINLDYYYKDM